MRKVANMRFSKSFILVILFILGIIIPFVTDSSFVIHLLVVSYLWAIMAGGYNLMMGYTGQLSLGHAAFYAIGGYTSALLVTNFGIPWPLGILAAALVTGIVSTLAGRLICRATHVYFVFITLGFSELVRLTLRYWTDVTGGAHGIVGVPPLFDSLTPTYCFVFCLMVLVYFFMYRITHSYIGRAFIAIKEDEEVAEATGIDTGKYRLLAFVLSATIIGIGGSVMIHYLGYCYPDLAAIHYTIFMLVYTVVGGAGYLIGPGAVAMFFTFLPEFFRVVGEYQPMIYGVVIILAVIFLGSGLEPVLRSGLARFRTRIISLVGAK